MNNTAKFSQKQLQVVLDIETYGVTSNAAIASIGALDFYVGEELKIESTFYKNIDQTRNKELDREFNPDTLTWWGTQQKEVRDALLKDQRPLDEVIKDLVEWIHPKSIVWVQGTDFDITIIRSTMQQLGYQDFPIKYYNLRDSRTLFKALGYDIRDYRNKELQHNALCDCTDQAKLLNHLLYQIKLANKE
jgi:hypothetical protein